MQRAFARLLSLIALPAALAACGELGTAVGAAPRARLSAPLYVQAGQPVQLDASAAYDPDGTVVAFTFWAGDGSAAQTGGLPDMTHVFAAPGAYEAAVVVRDDAGQLARATQLVVVREDAPACQTVADCPLGAECRADLHLCYAGGAGVASGAADCDSDQACTRNARCVAGLCLSAPRLR